MKIFYTKRFLKDVRKLGTEDQSRAYKALLLFEQNPFTPSLQNHPLKGAHDGTRSISAAYDLRLMYTEENGHITVLFLRAGSHKNVYE